MQAITPKCRLNSPLGSLWCKLWVFFFGVRGLGGLLPKGGWEKQWLHLLFPAVAVWRGEHLLMRLLCSCLCGQAGITGRPFTPAQTAVCSPSPSTPVRAALSAQSFPFLSLVVVDCHLPHFTLCIFDLAACVSVSVSSPTVPLHSHRSTNINSSSWELVQSFCGGAYCVWCEGCRCKQ